MQATWNKTHVYLIILQLNLQSHWSHQQSLFPRKMTFGLLSIIEQIQMLCCEHFLVLRILLRALLIHICLWVLKFFLNFSNHRRGRSGVNV